MFPTLAFNNYIYLKDTQPFTLSSLDPSKCFSTGPGKLTALEEMKRCTEKPKQALLVPDLPERSDSHLRRQS